MYWSPSFRTRRSVQNDAWLGGGLLSWYKISMTVLACAKEFVFFQGSVDFEKSPLVVIFGILNICLVTYEWIPCEILPLNAWKQLRRIIFVPLESCIYFDATRRVHGAFLVHLIAFLPRIWTWDCLWWLWAGRLTLLEHRSKEAIAAYRPSSICIPIWLSKCLNQNVGGSNFMRVRFIFAEGTANTLKLRFIRMREHRFWRANQRNWWKP